jgi:hypothetical protein
MAGAVHQTISQLAHLYGGASRLAQSKMFVFCSTVSGRHGNSRAPRRSWVVATQFAKPRGPRRALRDSLSELVSGLGHRSRLNRRTARRRQDELAMVIEYYHRVYVSRATLLACNFCKITSHKSLNLKAFPTGPDAASIRSASAASLRADLFPLAVLHVVISLEQVGVFRVNPGPGPEFRARRNRLLLIGSFDEIASDRRSWRGCRRFEAAGDVVPHRRFLWHVFVPLAEIQALNRVRTATQRKDGKSQSCKYAASPHRANSHPSRSLT